MPGSVVDRVDVETIEPIGGVLGLALPSLPRGFLALLYGRKGIGKSTIALEVFERPWIWANEMTPDRIAAYARRLGKRAHTFVVPGDPLVLSPRAREGIFDSVSATRSPLETMKTLHAHCRATGARIVAIAHTTKRGDLAGREALAHEADSLIELDELDGFRRVVPHKHRAGNERTVLFRMGPKGPEAPKWDRYYSIEGTAPGFRIVPFPSRKTRFARRLAEASEGKGDALPQPPIAVAMEDHGRLGGWKEPTDTAERRGFALAHGLPYYDAEGTLHQPRGQHGVQM